MPDLLAWVAGLTAVLAAAAAFGRWVVRPAWRGLKLAWRCAQQVREFLDQWFGTDEQPGVPDRLDRIEWHVGNGAQTPMRHVVDRTSDELHDHLAQADQDRRTLARVVRHVGLEETTGGGNVGATHQPLRREP